MGSQKLIRKVGLFTIACALVLAGNSTAVAGIFTGPDPEGQWWLYRIVRIPWCSKPNNRQAFTNCETWGHYPTQWRHWPPIHAHGPLPYPGMISPEDQMPPAKNGDVEQLPPPMVDPRRPMSMPPGPMQP